MSGNAPSGHNDKPVSAKQVSKKLKSEASKLEKERKKQEKKEEAERKKFARATTKKVVAMSSKLSAPLASALHKAGEVLAKAQAAGVENDSEVVAFAAAMKTLDHFKKKTAEALSFYSKNAACELAPLPFETAAEVQQQMRDLSKKGQELKSKVIIPAAKAKR